MQTERFNEELATAAREMVEEPDLPDTLDRVVQMTSELITSCDLAGVSVVHRGEKIDTPSASGEELRVIDEWQFTLREGPCFDALRQQVVVTCNDLANDHRWPTWGPRIARDVGVHSSMSFRLFTTGKSFGALCVYARATNAFTREDLVEGQVLAAHAAVALAGSLRETQLVQALESRTTIGQATGIVMERFNMSAEQAFAALRRLSSHHNVKLHQLAQQVIETRNLPKG